MIPITRAIRERARFALTADIWENLGNEIKSYPPACFKQNLKYRDVLNTMWKLFKKHPQHCPGLITGDPFIAMSLIMIGLVGRRVCGCDTCLGYNLTSDVGEIE